MTTWLQDLRSGFRSLFAAPGTAAAAIAVIALGAGVNTAVFTIAYGILLRPFPYPEVSRLAILSIGTPDRGDFGVPLSEVEEWRRRLRTVAGLAGYTTREVAVRGRGEPLLVEAALVTESFFDVLGVPAARGRLGAFAEGEGSAVVSEDLAARLAPARAGGAVGGSLRVGERAYELGAIVPREFAFPADGVDVWIRALPAVRREGSREPEPRSFHLVARLAPGVSMEQVRQDAERVLRDLRGVPAGEPMGSFPKITPVEEAVVGGLRPVLAAAGAAAVLVLLVTCGNVAMLLLGRAVVRRRDSALRLALGSPAWRLVRGALSESLILSALGSLVGLGLAAAAVRIFALAAAGVLPRLSAVALDAPTLAAAAATVLGVTLLCGAAPAWGLGRRRDLRPALSAGKAEEPRASRLMAALVVGQLAVSVMLATGAVLLARTVTRLLAEDVGIESERVLVAKLPLPGGETLDTGRQSAFSDELLARVRALPGVEEAGLGSDLPPAGSPFQIYFHTRENGRDEGQVMSVVAASPGFLDALGARLVAGTLFPASSPPAEPVVLLSESAARFLAPGENLVGRELPMPLPPIARFAGRPRVLGIVRDVKYAGLDQPAAAALYLPWSARPVRMGHLVVRTAGDPAALAPAVRRLVRELAPDIPLGRLGPLEDEMARSIAGRRLRVVPAVGFAAVALAVALTGVFALLARAAAERRREMAVRLAVGASVRGIQGLMVRRAAVLAAAGIAAGLAGALAMGKSLESLLFGVEPHDPLSLAGVVAFVAAASLLAAWLPARRAAAVEPAELLRTE